MAWFTLVYSNSVVAKEGNRVQLYILKYGSSYIHTLVTQNINAIKILVNIVKM
jgi:hypothetical protein